MNLWLRINQSSRTRDYLVGYSRQSLQGKGCCQGSESTLCQQSTTESLHYPYLAFRLGRRIDPLPGRLRQLRKVVPRGPLKISRSHDIINIQDNAQHFNNTISVTSKKVRRARGGKGGKGAYCETGTRSCYLISRRQVC